MVEYHGWINIKQSVDGENEEEIDKILERIKRLFNEKLIPNEFFVLKTLNYSNILHFGGSHNHGDKDYNQKVVGLFEKVASCAPGSFGLLYYWDNEDPLNSNDFVVYKMTKGVVEKNKDNLLSPCNPTIDE